MNTELITEPNAPKPMLRERKFDNDESRSIDAELSDNANIAAVNQAPLQIFF